MSSGCGSATEILERLHLKLVVADTDVQLQRFTDNHLIQVIQTAAANPDTVSLVTEILSFFNRRIKNNEGITFPVRELLKLVGGGTYLTNLSTIYLKIAFGRLSSQEKIELLPSILERLVDKVENKSACNDIFLLLIPGLVAVSKMPREKWPSLPDMTKVSDRLCRYFTILMLFENDRGSAQRLQMCAANVEAESTYPGLSQEDCSFLQNKVLHSYPSLTEVKDAIVHLLDYDFLPETAAFPVLVVSSACQLNRLFSNLGFSVSDASSLALKKVDIQNCVDDPKVVETLMSLYLGSAASQEKNIPVQQKIPHCSALIKAKVLPYLTRSTVAPTTFMNNVKICLDVEKDIQYSKKTLALLQFIMAVTEKMPPAALNAFANAFFSKMLKIIESGEIENAQCAALAYRCLALLGKSKPELVLTRMDLIENLFTCIADNAEDVSYAIMECLSSWQSAFSDTVDTPVLEKLKDIVKAHIAHENNRTRLSAIKYADALLRTGDMEIRWLLIRGAGDKRDDVRREGARLLEASFKLPTPSIEAIVNYIWREQNKSQVEAGDDYVKMTAEIYEMSTKFIWAACSVRAGDSQQLFFLEDDEHFFVTAPMVANLLKSLPQEVVEKAAKMAVQAATFSQDLFLLRIATCFVAVYPIVDMPACALACAQLARGSSRFEVLETASRLSVMTATSNENANNLEKYLSDLDSNPLPGTPWLAASTLVFADIPQKAALFERMYKRLLILINQAYDHPSSMLESVFGALSLLLKNGLQIYTLDKEQAFELIDVCEKVAVSRKDAITLRARHAAVEAIGLFNSKSSTEVGQKMATALFTVGEGPPQSALQLGVGAALWNTCLGPFSALRREAYLLTEASVQISSLQAAENEWCLTNISHVLNILLTEKVVSRNHHLRRAAVVWLMIFVQKAAISAPSSIKGCITQIQTAFAEALTENDDFTQDIASKGMGLVYQMAGPEEKKLLIGDLMSALGEGRTSSVKVQNDTVVFKDNMLGKAPDGSNLTTYKELCSLATDLNQPDLLYKFMQLAKHNASWNAKKGAAFGFGEILEQARDELQPYFGQLAPKLFRYRYDPDLKVQQSMKSIWSVLTAGKRNVIEEYADPIAKELFPLLTDREWRVRESSCLALADLLHSNDTPYMHSQLPAFFETVMRVRDDIKESVRLAAERTADSLRKLITRLATTSNKAKAEAFLTTFLPIIIEKGVNSTVKATVEFSLVLLMELSKTAGKQLQSFLHILVPCFLDAISDNESAVLNYMAVRSSANQLEQLDDLRSQFAGTSPMMSAINDLLPYIDSSALQTMQPRVCDQLRSSIGVSTRAAAAQFITQLTLRAPQLLIDNKPSYKFFASLAPGVSDRNPSVRKNSANALSYLAKFVSAGPVDKLMGLMNKNLVSDSEDSKKASLHVLKNFSAHCPDIIQGHGAQILPYIFLETCREMIKGDDASKKRHEEWNELWEELVPSTSSALVLYRKEVVAVAVDLLHNSQVWTVKAQAGRMLARVAESLGSLHLNGADADQVLSSLLPLLSGRTWDGKEKILLAISSILVASGSQLAVIKGTVGMNEISEILKREAGKKKKSYVTFALSSCAAFAEHTPSTEMAQWLQKKVQALVSRILDPNAEKSDSEDDSLSNLEKEALVAKFLSTNLVAFTTCLGAYRNGAEAEEPIKVLASLVSNTNLYWKARQDVLVELHSLVSRWELVSPVSSDPLVQSLLTVAEEMCDNQRKSVAAQALQIVMKMAERRGCFRMNWDVITAALQNSRAAKETGLSDRLDSALQMETD